jgi:hypothetical protein
MVESMLSRFFLKCKKCGGTDVSSEAVKRRQLWAILLGTSLVVVGFMLFLLGCVVETHGLSQTGPIVTVIPGISILAFGLRQDPVYVYACKSCGKSWKRSAKQGPEEGDPRHVEFQTEWQILRLAHDDINHREQAAKWLGEHRSISAVDGLITCLGDRRWLNTSAMIEATKALKRIGDERAIQPLIKAATDTGRQYVDVRVAALSALSAFRGNEIQEILEGASNDENASIRKAATESLADFNQSR